MSIMDKSIASRIALLLGLFCLVLCAFLISLLQLLKMLSEEADETVNVALPNMAIASYISKESEWAKGILHFFTLYPQHISICKPHFNIAVIHVISTFPDIIHSIIFHLINPSFPLSCPI